MASILGGREYQVPKLLNFSGNPTNLEGKYVALTCCRVNREKGLDYLIPIIPEVRARHQDFRLVMVGSGSLEEELRREIAELGIGDVVQMVGWRDDSMDWIAAADLVIQPSRGESFCQVLLEALALKKPVVMTPVERPRDHRAK